MDPKIDDPKKVVPIKPEIKVGVPVPEEMAEKAPYTTEELQEGARYISDQLAKLDERKQKLEELWREYKLANKPMAVMTELDIEDEEKNRKALEEDITRIRYALSAILEGLKMAGVNPEKKKMLEAEIEALEVLKKKNEYDIAEYKKLGEIEEASKLEAENEEIESRIQKRKKRPAWIDANEPKKLEKALDPVPKEVDGIKKPDDKEKNNVIREIARLTQEVSNLEKRFDEAERSANYQGASFIREEIESKKRQIEGLRSHLRRM